MNGRRILRFGWVLLQNGAIAGCCIAVLYGPRSTSRSTLELVIEVGLIALALAGLVMEATANSKSRFINILTPSLTCISMIASVVYAYSPLAGSHRETDPLGVLAIVFAMVPLIFALATFLIYRAVDIEPDTLNTIL